MAGTKIDVPFGPELGVFAMPIRFARPNSTLRYMPSDYKQYGRAYRGPRAFLFPSSLTTVGDSGNAGNLWLNPSPGFELGREFPVGKISQSRIPENELTNGDVSQVDGSVLAGHCWSTPENPGLYKNGLATCMGVNPKLRAINLALDVHLNNPNRYSTPPSTFVVPNEWCGPGEDEEMPEAISPVPLSSSVSTALPQFLAYKGSWQTDFGVMGSRPPVITSTNHAPSSKLAMSRMEGNYGLAQCSNSARITRVVPVSSAESEWKADATKVSLMGVESDDGATKSKVGEPNVLAQSMSEDWCGGSSKKRHHSPEKSSINHLEIGQGGASKFQAGQAPWANSSGSGKRMKGATTSARGTLKGVEAGVVDDSINPFPSTQILIDDVDEILTSDEEERLCAEVVAQKSGMDMHFVERGDSSRAQDVPGSSLFSVKTDMRTEDRQVQIEANVSQWQRTVRPASHSVGHIEETRNYDEQEANSDNGSLQGDVETFPEEEAETAEDQVPAAIEPQHPGTTGEGAIEHENFPAPEAPPLSDKGNLLPVASVEVRESAEEKDGGIEDHKSEPDDSGEVGSTDDQENTNESLSSSEDGGSVVERSEDVGRDNEHQTNVDSKEESSDGVIGYVPQCDQPLLEKFMRGEFGGEDQEVNDNDDSEHQSQAEGKNH